MMEQPSEENFRPGDHPDDYRYLFEGHPQLLTDLERRAWTRIMMQRKVAHTENEQMKAMMSRHWLTSDDAVTEVLSHGEKRFFAQTLKRVLAATPEALNTCPRCGSLCRTSAACLCPHCSHTWFESRKAQSPISQFAETTQADQPVSHYALFREDDNGARFLIAPFESLEAAEQRAAELAQRGHKQHYFVEPVPAEPPASP